MSALRAALGIGPKDRKGSQLEWRKVREVARYMAQGLSRSAACGKASVNPSALTVWERDFPAVSEVLADAKLKRLAMLEEGLLEANAKMPQVVSRIFALKNADPSLWQENPNKDFTPGLYTNITVITGVPEAQAPQVVIEHHAGPMIEATPDGTGGGE